MAAVIKTGLRAAAFDPAIVRIVAGVMVLAIVMLLIPAVAGTAWAVVVDGALLLSGALFLASYVIAGRVGVLQSTNLGEPMDLPEAASELLIRHGDGRVVRAHARVIEHADGGITVFDVRKFKEG